MKTVNIKSDIQTFYDSNNKIKNFVGEAKVYNEYIYVDTRNGEGYDKVLKKMGGYIYHLSNKFDLSNDGFDMEDTKQYIGMLIIEGIKAYDPGKKASLSSFLHIRIERLLINRISYYSIEDHNPTILKTCLYSIGCKCGSKYTITMSSKEDVRAGECMGCAGSLEDARIFAVNVPPEGFNAFVKRDGEDMNMEEGISYADADIRMVYGSKGVDIDNAIDIYNIVESQKDSQIKDMLKMVLEDCSVNEAAKRVGISHTWGQVKIKELRNNKRIREVLCR